MSIEQLEGTAAAPPRDNGELVFSEPWQARAFGVAAELVEGGHFTWDGFRGHLIAAVAAAENAADRGGASEPWDYYRCWLAALEQAVAEGGLVAPEALQGRAEQFAARPVGHDH